MFFNIYDKIKLGDDMNDIQFNVYFILEQNYKKLYFAWKMKKTTVLNHIKADGINLEIIGRLTNKKQFSPIF